MLPETALARSIGDADARACQQILRAGSRSFAVAAYLLPGRMRRPVAALYAFCRVADDAIDEGTDPSAALEELHARLDRVYADAAADDAVERSLARVVHTYGIARPVLDALLDGFAADVGAVRVQRIDELLDYAVRVASTVGVAMTLVMGVRDRHVLARASDLGVAMQLTNIARDVGEDARRGRLYLPVQWCVEVDLDPERWITTPRFEPGVGVLVERVLALADLYYRRADVGIAELPADCRSAIRAASRIYADIGRVIRSRGCDSVTRRAHTSTLRKLVLVLRATWSRAPVDPQLLRVDAVPLARALVDACVSAQ